MHDKIGKLINEPFVILSRIYSERFFSNEVVIRLDTTLLNRYISVYQEDLTRLCISLCRNIPDAEDLYQDTWLKVMCKYQKYDESKPFDKWLFTICVNTYKDRQKSFWKKKQFHFSSNEDKELFLSSIPDVPEFDGQSEMYDTLLNCLIKLPLKYNMIISLFYFKDYSEKEVASILNIPIGTVKSRLHKAKKILKELILNA